MIRKLAILCFILLPTLVNGYEPETHQTMTAKAAFLSVLGNPQTLANLGLAAAQINDDSQLFQNSELSAPISILNLMRFGSAFEDDRRNFQALYHFYNPISGEGLKILGREPGAPSPDWALEDGPQFGDNQPFSYKRGRQYLLNALTKQSRADRDKNWGLTFQTIGQIVHHLQDMSQPQHVRNDAHCDSFGCGVAEFFGLPFYSKSAYERWTRDYPPPDIAFDGYAPVYTKDDFRYFTFPRKFWTTAPFPGASGLGIAEYTNRGFFSARTNADKRIFPEPQIDRNAPTSWTIQDLCDEAVANNRPPCPSGVRIGSMKFFSNMVTDRLRETETRENSRATTLSIFDSDLKAMNFNEVFTLNRFTIDAAQKFLLPRAVGYSAGMINYFFRGEIDFIRDENDATKFRIVNLGNEYMSGHFALYYDAKDGNRYPVDVDPSDPNMASTGPGWQLTVTAKTVPDDKQNKSAPVSFISPPFDDSPTAALIPNEYMLVFNGDMGEEKATNGSVGAVVAKTIKAAYNGAIYVRVKNAGGLATLRVDKNGTRYVQAGEFDPLKGPWNFEQFHSQGQPAYLTKQVEFTKDPLFGHTVHRTKTIAVGMYYTDTQFPVSYALDGPSGFRVINPAGVSWLAASPDPAIGEFIIGSTPRIVPDWKALSFTRTYTQENQTLTATGKIPLNLTSSQYFYPRLISGDGLRAGEIIEQSPDPVVSIGAFWSNPNLFPDDSYQSRYSSKSFDVAIALSQTPAAAPELVYDRSIVSSNKLVPGVCQILSTGLISESIGNCRDLRNINWGGVVVGGVGGWSIGSYDLKDETRTFLGYFNGTKVALKSVQMVSGSQDFWSHDTLAPHCSFGEGYSNQHFESTNTTYFSDQPMVTAFTYTPYASNYTYGGASPGCGPAAYLNYITNPDPGTQTGKIFVRALTDKAKDAFYFKGGDPIDYNGGRQYYFREIPLQNQSYVADASPMGEVFFAKSDLSIIIQDSQFGLPMIQIPSDVKKIIAVIWL